MTGTTVAAEVEKTGRVRVTPATWWRRPQQVWLRRAIFQIHLWMGLLLAAYAIVIGLSGAALVFKADIERHLQPELFHVAPQSVKVSLDAVIRRVESERPGWKVSGVKDFEDPTRATTLLLRPVLGQLSANYRMVMVEPYTGVELRDTMRFAGVLGWLSNLHFYLLAGKTGLKISGWMTVGLAVLCATGLVLWWPGVHRWASAIYLRRHVRWRRLNWDLHSVVGFWVALPLLTLCLTGLYFSFPEAIAKAASALTWSKPTATTKLPTQHDLLHGPLTADLVVQMARETLPRDAPAGYLALPVRKGGAYFVTGYYKDAAPYAALVSLSFDGQTGKLLRYDDTRQKSRGERLIQHVFAWHFGSFGGTGWPGTVVKAVWVLIGLSPALLALTGTIMFVVRKLI